MTVRNGSQATTLAEPPTAEPGSFRDPDSRVFVAGGQVFRVFNRRGAAVVAQLIGSETFQSLVDRNMVVSTEVLEPTSVPEPISSLPEPALVVGMNASHSSHIRTSGRSRC